MERQVDESLSPQSCALVHLHLFSLLCSVLRCWRDDAFPRKAGLCWSVSLNNLLCHYSLQKKALQFSPFNHNNTNKPRRFVLALIPPFITFNPTQTHTHTHTAAHFAVACAHVIARHVSCPHQLCITYYLHLFNSSKLS